MKQDGSACRAGGRTARAWFAFGVFLVLGAHAMGSAGAPKLAEELSTEHFSASINGHAVAVSHAAANYYFLNFDLKGTARITIAAPTADYWAKGVEVQPWRLGIRPAVNGRTISFTLKGPAKLSIARPGDHLAGAEMFFLFANAPETDAPKKARAGLRYYGPGVYHENIDAKSGDNIYLADGAVVLGSLNLWDVENVKVFGRGVILYDGPQDPEHDEGWKNLRNWHAIVMHNARRISISGITCIVRSRTWMIQMRDSRSVVFDNVKVIGGSPGNANQDGMDWLGGGDAVVRDSFIRAADDIFAMYGNWDGYTAEALATPGHEVSNITVEDSVLSTSISNVVRVGWPRKSFDSHHFVMRNSDVLHMGSGGCGVPFALFEIWADPGGKGEHSDYLFEDIRLEDWYSLAQLRQPNADIHHVVFRDIYALETPSLAPSVLLGQVDGVVLDDVKLAGKVARQDADIPISSEQGAQPAVFQETGAPLVGFTYSSGLIVPGRKVLFKAASIPSPDEKPKSYEWSFGDGSYARGPVAYHAFPDTAGTLWDHSGRFRVLLKVTDAAGRSAWADEPVTVADSLHPALPEQETLPGLKYRYYESDAVSLAALPGLQPVAAGVSDGFTFAMRKRDENYGLAFDGYLDVPADGGYTFTLLSTDEGEMSIDSQPIARSPKPWPQVCGLAGNAVQLASGSMALAKGRHAIHVAATHGRGKDGFAVLWQGPGLPLSAIPPAALSQPQREAAVRDLRR